MTPAPRVGELAPPLELPATTAERFRLDACTGQWTVVAFYPHDFGTLCTRQLRGYASVFDELTAGGATLVAISCDSLDDHRRFHDQHHFPFPLLSDADGAVAARWGVTGPRHTTKRASFVVDPASVVRDVFVSRTAATWRSPRELLAVVRGAGMMTA